VAHDLLQLMLESREPMVVASKHES
jgi:hypothetical protein